MSVLTNIWQYTYTCTVSYRNGARPMHAGSHTYAFFMQSSYIYMHSGYVNGKLALPTHGHCCGRIKNCS